MKTNLRGNILSTELETELVMDGANVEAYLTRSERIAKEIKEKLKPGEEYTLFTIKSADHYDIEDLNRIRDSLRIRLEKEGYRVHVISGAKDYSVHIRGWIE